MPVSPFVANLRRKIGHDLISFTGINAVVLNDRREILLVHSKETGQWMPVGGMIEPGEEPADAAVREVFEETGVRIAAEKLTGVYDGPAVVYSNGDHVHYITIVFLCRAIAGEPHPHDGENRDARFFPIDQLPPLREDYRRNIQDALANRAEAFFLGGHSAGKPVMSPFVLLADPKSYVACSWDLSLDAEGRAHWIEFFKRHLETILKLGAEAAADRQHDMNAVNARVESCRKEFIGFFDEYAAHPRDVARYGVDRVTILTLDQWRDAILRRHGFVDAFLDMKNRENQLALPLLPVVCDQIDALSGVEQFRAIIEGVFAGNIFDMGADATAKAFLKGGPDFFQTRKTLCPRPWLVDDFDAAARRFVTGKPHRKAVFFIDNAGSDFLLGALPMIRWLALRGTHVVLAANERPTLNDMTIHDVNAWWPRILQVLPSLASLPIERISTGTGEPLIDLSAVSGELNAAAKDADLVILEGMGRGVESNLDAQFACDAMNLAMIKDTMIAKRNSGVLFDVICRFR
jgi:type II pantothenate kinase